MKQSIAHTPDCKSFTFTVLGKAAPQGSKRHVGRGVMVESSKRCKPWRQDVRHTAIDLLPDEWHANMDSAMHLSAVFVFPRPKAHFKANGQLKPNAPSQCKGRVGDISKLVRAVEDALTGVVYSDDAQIVSLSAQRRFANGSEQPSAIITIIAIA